MLAQNSTFPEVLSLKGHGAWYYNEPGAHGVPNPDFEPIRLPTLDEHLARLVDAQGASEQELSTGDALSQLRGQLQDAVGEAGATHELRGAYLSYIVSGVDLSPELIEVAKRTAGNRTGGVSFAVADITVPPTARYAQYCAGASSIIDDDRRDAVFAAFARALRPNGALFLDVREWGVSAERKTREPLFRKRVSTLIGEISCCA